jgi:hypothetical protein
MANHSFTFASSASTSRASSAIYAAVAAVGIISGTLVTLQLAAPPSAAAITVAAAPVAPITQTAKGWDLEQRWWGGETHSRAAQPAPAATPAAPSATPARAAAAEVPESELTFTKGYALRLAARHAAGQVDQVADLAPAAEGKSGVARPAVVARNVVAPVRAAVAPAPRSLAPTPVAAPIESPASDAGSQTLAFDEPRGTPHAAVFPNLFGRLY